MEDAARREGDVVGVETGGGHLVQQRLEGVEVVGVDEGDVDRCVAEGLDRRQPAEAGADDDDAWRPRTRPRPHAVAQPMRERATHRPPPRQLCSASARLAGTLSPAVTAAMRSST